MWFRVIGILLLGSMSVLGMNQAENQFARVEIDEERDMTDVKKLVAERERVGRELMAIVTAPHDAVGPREAVSLIQKRHEAGRLLGELQYLPAIEALIQHVGLVDPTNISSEERPDLDYPMTMALAAYGNAAVPQIVDAALAERNQQRLMLLAYAIRFGKTTDIALRYLRGSEPPAEEDWLKKQNMKELEERLQWLAAKVVAPDHATK